MTYNNQEIKIKAIVKEDIIRNLSMTPNNIAYLKQGIDDKIVIDVDVERLDISANFGFDKFISELDSGVDFSLLKQNLSYDMKIVINNIRKKVKDCDIVHTHHGGAYFEGILAKLFFGKKFVVSVNGLILKDSFLESTLDEAVYKQYITLEKLAIEMADVIIVDCEMVKKDILTYYTKIDKNKIYKVYKGIDIKKFAPSYSTTVLKKYGINPDIPYACIIGRIDKLDDLSYAIKVAERLVITSQVVFAIKFPEGREIKEFYNSRLDRLRKTRVAVISIEEEVDVHDRRVLYSHASAVCFPFICDPSIIYVLEALACGTPFVSTSLGCVRDIIKHGECGFLIEPGLSPNFPFEPSDKDGFVARISEAVNRIIADKSLNKRLSARSRENIEDNFNWEIIGKRLSKIYEKTLLT